MHPKSIAFVFACILANVLMASPLALRDTNGGLTPNNYTELWREPATTFNGDLVYYGLPNSTVTEKRSSSTSSTCSAPATPSATCYTSHEARNDPCDALVTELQGDGNVPVAQSPRQICYEGNSENNQYCCVSWHNVVPNLEKSDLFLYAYSIFATCTTNGISGKVDNVQVHQTCTNVCLSNRGNGC